MIHEGLQYGFGEFYWRTKPRGVRNIFFVAFFCKRPINLKIFIFLNIPGKTFTGSLIN